MTAASATGSPRSAGRCTSMPCLGAGRGPTRHRSPLSPLPSSGFPRVRSCCSTGWSPRRPPRCSCPTRADCAWWCSCTCRSVTARRITRSATSAHGNARSCRPLPPSSRPARGHNAGWWSCTGCPRTGFTSPSPPSTLPTSRPRARPARRCSASRRRPSIRATMSCSMRSWRSRICPGIACAWAAWTAIRRSYRASVAALVDAGLDDRVHLAGPRTGAALQHSYAAADLVVLASRAETYGMVVTEALARGVPVLAADVGGVAEALGHAAHGIRPGLLVPPGDPAALGDALRAWLGDAELRSRLRRAARERRGSLAGWSTTATVIAGVLAGASR